MKLRLTLAIIAVFLLGTSICHAHRPADEDLEISEDAVLGVSQDMLNRVVKQLGVLSDAGISQPQVPRSIDPRGSICHFVGYMACPELPGEFGGLGFGNYGIPLMFCEPAAPGGVSMFPVGDPVPWQWWITNAYFTVNDGYMTFTATLRWRVKDVESVETHTVDGNIFFDAFGNYLSIVIDRFKVVLTTEVSGEIASVAEVDVAKLYNLSVRLDPQKITVPLLDGTEKTVTGKVLGLAADYKPGWIILEYIDIGF